MKAYIMILVVLLLAGQLAGLVAYNGMNQRNHPELSWMSIQTANCQILYHAPLASQALQTAGIAQNTFDTMVKTYQITPTRKCIIYVSDQDNIPNGAAAGSFYIFIWVNQNDFTGMFTGNDKWIRKVVGHEISHWFLAAATECWLAMFLPGVPPFPRDLNEGYAQYFSGEPWGYNRGDRFLKASVLSHKDGIASPENAGGLMYAEGFSRVRYLTAMYGEQNLIKLLKYRNKARLYGFKDAFKEVYRKDYSEFETEWQRYVSTYYFGEVYAYKATPADTTAAGNINDFRHLKTDFYQLANLDWKDSRLLLTGRASESQKYLELCLADVVSDSLKANKLVLKKQHSIYKAGRYNKISLSQNGKWAAFSVYTRHRHGRLAPRIFLYDAQKHKLNHFGEGNFPEADTLGGVYYQKLGKESNDIWYLQPDAGVLNIHAKAVLKVHLNDLTKVYSLGFDEQIGNLSLSPDNSKLAFTVFDKAGKFNISILDIASGQITSVLPLDNMAQSISWQSNDELLYGIQNPANFALDIAMYDPAKASQRYLSHPPYNAVPFRYLDGKMYVMADFDRGAKVPGSFLPRFNTPVQKTFSENYYNKWVSVKPIHDIPDNMGKITVSAPQKYVSWRNIKWRMGFVLPTANYFSGTTVFSEALGKQLLVATGAIPYRSVDRAWWGILYQNNTLEPTLNLLYSRQQWISGLGEDKIFYQNIDKVGGRATYPINLLRPFRQANLSFDLSYTDVKNANANPIFEDKGFAATGVKTGYGYSLPWKSSDLHKVRSYDADYSLQMASGKLGMNTDFNQHSFHAGFAYAPLLHLADNEIVRTISLENRSNYEFVNGNQLLQFLPGTNQYDIVQSSYKPAFKRYYLRGYEGADYLSKKLLNVQNELNIKLSDDIGFNVLGENLAVHFVGLTLWNDHTQLSNIQDSGLEGKSRTYNANGFELRAQTSMFEIPTVLKYGIAYDMSFERLSDYFLIEIPLLQLIKENM